MIVIIGPPGAGKSRQASLLAERGIAHWISIGQLLRDNLTGNQKASLDDGELIDDDLVADLLIRKLNTIKSKDHILIDGFPRRESQTDWLFSKQNPRKFRGVIVVEAKTQELIKRLLGRGRADDKIDVIKERIDTYHEELTAILSHFSKYQTSIVKIDGNGSVEQVYERVRRAVHLLGED